MGALRFIREKLKPLIANKYQGRAAVVVIDPAAFQRAQTDERSVADVFKTEGFTVKPARTNSIAARITAGEQYMTRTVDGKAALLIDPGCTDMITTMPGQIAAALASAGSVQLFSCPFPMPSIVVKQYWHSRFHRDPGNQWLRAICAQQSRTSLDPGNPWLRVK